MNSEQNENKSSKKSSFIAILVIIVLSGLFHFFYAFINMGGNQRDYKFRINHKTSNITEIYLVDAKSPNDYEILKEISLEEKEYLINEFDQFTYYTIEISTQPNTFGKAFLIKYDDGCYDLIARNYPCNCVIEDSKVVVYCYKCGLNKFEDSFDRLLVKYLTN